MPVFRNNQHQNIADSVLFASYSLSILHPDDIAFAVKFYGVFGVRQIVPVQPHELPELRFFVQGGQTGIIYAVNRPVTHMQINLSVMGYKVQKAVFLLYHML